MAIVDGKPDESEAHRVQGTTSLRWPRTKVAEKCWRRKQHIQGGPKSDTPFNYVNIMPYGNYSLKVRLLLLLLMMMMVVVMIMMIIQHSSQVFLFD